MITYRAESAYRTLGLRSSNNLPLLRRDRMLLVAALAIALLTLLGAAGESLGMERLLKANTVKTRSYSLFRQGVLYYKKIPTIRQDQFSALMVRFNDTINQHAALRASLGLFAGMTEGQVCRRCMELPCWRCSSVGTRCIKGRGPSFVTFKGTT